MCLFTCVLTVGLSSDLDRVTLPYVSASAWFIYSWLLTFLFLHHSNRFCTKLLFYFTHHCLCTLMLQHITVTVRAWYIRLPSSAAIGCKSLSVKQVLNSTQHARHVLYTLNWHVLDKMAHQPLQVFIGAAILTTWGCQRTSQCTSSPLCHLTVITVM